MKLTIQIAAKLPLITGLKFFNAHIQMLLVLMMSGHFTTCKLYLKFNIFRFQGCQSKSQFGLFVIDRFNNLNNPITKHRQVKI
jgi:cytochrome b subunit of formate dehydrogenase